MLILSSHCSCNSQTQEWSRKRKKISFHCRSHFMQIKLILFTSRIFLSLLEDLIDMDAAMMAFNCCKIRPGWFFIYFNFMLNSSMHPPNITVPFKESLFTKSYLNEWGNPEIAQLNDIFQISNKIQNELPHECGPLCLNIIKKAYFFRLDWASNSSCSDAMTLPISDWLFYSEGGTIPPYCALQFLPFISNRSELC